MMKNVVIIAGGSEAEFQVSLASAFCLSKQIAKDNLFHFFNVIVLPDKRWIYSNDFRSLFINTNDIQKISYTPMHDEVFQIGKGKMNDIKIDCALLATLGRSGEDGEIQGFLKMNQIKFTGSDILGSCIAADKEICKIVVKNMGIDVVPYFTLYRNENYDKEKIQETLGENIVVKIADGGSSIGVFDTTIDFLDDCLSKAFLLCPKILLEKKLNVRELSIGFLSNKFSLIGEDHQPGFKTFESKYLTSSQSEYLVPAPINNEIHEKILGYAEKIKKGLDLKNFGRIDFFLDEHDIVYFNEVNSVPGMTCNSIFPKLWSHHGEDSLSQIITTIIEDVSGSF